MRMVIVPFRGNLMIKVRRTYIDIFFGQAGTCIEPTKVQPWLALSGKKFICALRCSENALPALSVLRFPGKTFSKLHKFTLRSTPLCG